MPHINKLYEDMEDDIILSCDDFKSLLHKLLNKSSSGPDGISNILFKKLSEELYKPICRIFRLLVSVFVHPLSPVIGSSHVTGHAVTCVIFECVIK